MRKAQLAVTRHSKAKTQHEARARDHAKRPCPRNAPAGLRDHDTAAPSARAQSRAPSPEEKPLAATAPKTNNPDAPKVHAVAGTVDMVCNFGVLIERALTKEPTENNFNGFVVLPYVQGISEKIGRILKQQKVKVAYKPQLTINSLFPRPKEQDESDRQKSGIVYKINCTQCNFVYYGQTEKQLKTRIVEHKKVVAGFDQNSKVANHVHHSSHNMDPQNVKAAGPESNHHERPPPKARHSTPDPNAGNNHITIPEPHKGTARAQTLNTVTRASPAPRLHPQTAPDNELRPSHFTDEGQNVW